MAEMTVSDHLSIVTTNGDKGNMTITTTADLVLNNPARNSGGRALVTGGGDQLIINFGNDFKGGVSIQGKVNLANLEAPPPGVATDRVVVDADGNLYKLD